LFANQGGDIRKSLHSIAAARNEPAAVTTNVGECAKAIVFQFVKAFGALNKDVAPGERE
jgi:hypothetical protein